MRLGDDLYYAATLIALLITAVAITGFVYTATEGDPYVQTAALVVAGLVWAMGRTCRLLLTGR
jgi:hypothetical protein